MANASDENPAKTTECIAPILAHANTENANSGIIGKYIQTLSPFFTPIDFRIFAVLETSFNNSK